MRPVQHRCVLRGLILLLTLTATPAAFATDVKPIVILGMDAAACAQDSIAVAVLVRVRGLKDSQGKVRLELYSDKPDDFLKSPEYLKLQSHVFRRVDVPTPVGGHADICMALPTPGRYSSSTA